MIYSITAKHGDDLDGDDYQTLNVIRRTLLGMLNHGFITDLNTYAGPTETVWSYRGTDDMDAAEGTQGMLDVLKVIAPKDWVIETSP